MLKNKAIDVQTFFVPFVRPLIASLLSLPSPVLIAIDATQMGRGCQCLMMSILYRNRALPIAWRVVDYARGEVSEAIQLDLLREVIDLFPENSAVVVLGDGAFDNVKWLETIDEAGWLYVIRTRRNSLLMENGYPFKFHHLDPGDMTIFGVPDTYFSVHYYGPLLAIVWHDRHYKEPIYLITNYDSTLQACAWYGRRFQIETLFSDQKSRGFAMHKSHLSNPEKLNRLMIAIALAYIWIIHLGVMVQQTNLKMIIHRKKRSDLSDFQFGIRYLQHLLNMGLPIPVDFKPFTNENMAGAKCVRY